MITDTALLFAILTPVLGAFILPLVGRYSAAARNWLALVLIGIPLVFSLMCIPSVYSGEVLSFMYSLPLGFNLTFVADPLAIFMAIVSSLISFVIMIYSFDYISHYDNQNEYYFMVVLFLGSMIGLIFAANLILLYIFWELTGITSWRLIGFYRGKSDIYRANKSFLVTVFGALVMLLGFIIVYQQTGSFDYNSVCDTGKNYMISNLAVLLILFGILSKSATLPFHTWLPDAGVAPSPVTALLHAAVLVKIGVYVYARLFLATYSIDEIWTTAVPLIAGFSALVAAGAAFVETDLKRIIAYSTISQIGFIFLGLSVNSYIGLAGGLLYILMHGLAKAGLFLSAGIIEQNMKTKNVTQLGGLITTMPVTAVSFLFCSFSVMGIPPFGGFFSKFMVIRGAIETKDMLIVTIFVIGAVMTILYLFRTFNLIFLGEPKTVPVKEQSFTMVAVVALLAVLSLAAGVFINYPSEMACTIVDTLQSCCYME